jgi:hypothetical protein
MMVSACLWMGGALTPPRYKELIRQVAACVRKTTRPYPLLVAVDGLVSYVDACVHNANAAPSPNSKAPTLASQRFAASLIAVQKHNRIRWITCCACKYFVQERGIPLSGLSPLRTKMSEPRRCVR